MCLSRPKAISTGCETDLAPAGSIEAVQMNIAIMCFQHTNKQLHHYVVHRFRRFWLII